MKLKRWQRVTLVTVTYLFILFLVVTVIKYVTTLKDVSPLTVQLLFIFSSFFYTISFLAFLYYLLKEFTGYVKELIKSKFKR